MIKYALTCEHGHGFEGWFGASADYDDQHARGLLQCPVCGSAAVRKQIMAPAVVGAKKGQDETPSTETVREMAMQAAAKIRQTVEDNFDYVGDTFAKEARAIHEGEAEERGIYGEATGAEVKALIDDGVPVAPLPPKPKAKDELN
jgi:hypothetical protein